jgi:signal transduction histidine kinase
MFSNPVAQFLVAAARVVGGVALATDVLAHRAAEDEAVADARATTELLAHSVAEPLIPARLAAGNLDAALAFDRVARERIMVDDVTRVKIWNEDGLVVYSDERSLIGDRFELGDGAREVLASGSSDAGVSDLRSPENRYELEAAGLLEVYTRIESPEGDPLLFEVYYSADRMREATEDIFAGFRPITVGGLVVLGVLTTPLLWMLSRRLERAAKARERLLRNAVAASAGERRRIAQDLHHGVVSDLTDAADLVGAEACNPELAPATAHRLRGVDDALRRSVQSLRSLVVEIYPPNLDSAGMRPALEDLLAPAMEAGMVTKVEVADLAGASEDALGLVWRVAREAVRNAVRHARASELDIVLRREARNLVLKVADNGVGFVPGAFSGADRLGLRAVTDLAAEAGGRLDVQSRPGRGTVVRLVTPG